MFVVIHLHEFFYQQSVRGEGGFLTRKCDSYDNFEKGNCDSNEVSYMGYSSNGTLPIGTYFLRTHPSKFGPALGENGYIHLINIMKCHHHHHHSKDYSCKKFCLHILIEFLIKCEVLNV